MVPDGIHYLLFTRSLINVWQLWNAEYVYFGSLRKFGEFLNRAGIVLECMYHVKNCEDKDVLLLLSL